MTVRAQEAPELVTIPDVPIVQVGIEYKLSTGPATFTEDDLRAAVAALDDPGIRTPGVKFGHNRKQLTQQPRIARIDNIRYDESDMTVYGDIVGMPRWIADIMVIAYPDRSIEGTYGLESGTGRTHQFVIEDLALLGEDAPGVSTLDDLYELFYGDGSYFTEGKVAAIRKGEAVSKKVAATVEVEDVRRAYYDSLDSSQMWWWIRAIRLDPDELIVDDDEGQLYRVPFSIDGEEITFSDPQPVRIQYEDVAAVTASLGAPLAVYASRAESRPETTEDNVTQRKKVAASDDLGPIRERLGLPEDATQEDILAALDEQKKPEGEGEPPAPEGEPEGKGDDGEAGEQPAKPTVSIPEGMTLVDDAQWQEMQEGVAAAREIAKENAKRHRDTVLAEAIKAGKFPRSRREHYAKMHVADPEGTEALLASMAKGLVPVEAIGSDSPEGGDTEAYPSHWFPEVAARRAAVEANGGQPPRIQFAQEG